MLFLLLINIVHAVKTINLYTWSKYVSQTVLNEFENKTGIKVNYCTFPSSEDGIQQVRFNPDHYDIIIVSQYYDLDMLIRERLIQKLDLSLLDTNIPINDEYSIPYSCGSTGILYNKKMIETYIPDWNRNSWNIFFDESFASRICNRFALLDDKSDILIAYMKYLQHNDKITNVAMTLSNAKIVFKNLQNIKKYINKFSSGLNINNLVAIQTYSSYGKKLAKQNEDLEYIIPKEGADLWLDVITISKSANKDSYQLVNHLLSSKMQQITLNELGITNKMENNKILEKTQYNYQDDYDIEILWMEFLFDSKINYIKYIYISLLILMIYIVLYRIYKQYHHDKK